MENIENILITNEEELKKLNKSNSSFTFDRINKKKLHFKDCNFNFLEPSILMKLETESLTIENCVLGNLHYLEFKNKPDLFLINQKIEYYLFTLFKSNYFKHIYLDNNHATSLELFSNKTYNKLTIKNNNIKGNLCTLRNPYISELHLEDILNYTTKDLEYLEDKLKKGQIKKLFFNNKEITNKNLNYLQRKIKIKNLLNE